MFDTLLREEDHDKPKNTYGVKYTLPSDNEGARQRRMRSPLRRPCFGAQSVKAERAQYDGHFSELGIISKTSYGVAHFTDSGNDTAHRYGHYYEIVSESLRCMFPDIGDLQMAVCSLLSEVPQDSLEHMSRRYEQEREKSNGSSKV